MVRIFPMRYGAGPAAWLGQILFMVVSGLLLGRAAHASVWIVDACHSESGRFCQVVGEMVAAEERCERLTLDRLDEIDLEPCDVVVLVRPDMMHYTDAAVDRLITLVLSPEVGLLVFGYPDDQDSVDMLYQRLGRRLPVQDNVPLAVSLKQSQWIWTSQGTRANSTVYFRGSFDVTAAPARARLAITTDNAETVHLNEQRLGHNGEWENVSVYDVTDVLRVGRNVIAVEAHNDDGPAGLLLSLQGGYGVDHRYAVDVRSDGAWRCRETVEEGWTGLGFDDSTWDGVAVLGRAGCQPWGNRAKLDLSSLDKPLHRAPSGHLIVTGLEGRLGTTAVGGRLMTRAPQEELLAVDEGAVAVAGDELRGRTVVVSIRPEACRLLDDRLDVFQSDTFARFVARTMLWLGRRPLSADSAAEVTLGTTGDDEFDMAGVVKVIDDGAFPLAMQPMWSSWG